MRNPRLKQQNKTTHYVLAAACVAASGLVTTTGMRAAHADEITPPRVRKT
jgi:hypothetical protein